MKTCHALSLAMLAGVGPASIAVEALRAQAKPERPNDLSRLPAGEQLDDRFSFLLPRPPGVPASRRARITKRDRGYQ